MDCVICSRYVDTKTPYLKTKGGVRHLDCTRAMCRHEEIGDEGICKACGRKAAVNIGPPADYFTRRNPNDLRPVPATTPEEVILAAAAQIWGRLVGCPVTEPYDHEFEQVRSVVANVHRAGFTIGLHEGVRQGKELGKNEL